MAQSSGDYTNLLEQQFSRLPGFIQAVLRDPFNWVDDLVRDIAGQPAELVHAGERYAALGKRIDAIGSEQYGDRTSILGGAWEGAAYDAFSAQMAQVEQQISALGQASTQTQPLLDAAAKACTQSADIIVEIVEGFVSWVLQDVVVSAVLSFFTFGGAAAAGAALAVERFAEVCAQIGRIGEKLAEVLRTIADLLRGLALYCENVTTFLKELQDALKAEKGFTNMKHWLAVAKRAGVTTAARGAVSYPLDGGPFPGPVGAGAGAVTHGYHAVGDVQQANG